MKPQITLSSNNLFGLYIHWPYCLSKCPYCDFASTACANIQEDILFNAYRRDLETAAALKKETLTSIYFGGGTPSLMSAAFLEKMLALIQTHFSFADDIEITLEANPDAITPEKMKAFASLGINRLSIGVQALNDADLKFLGRRHTAQTALARIAQGQKYFKRLTMDLIYARPNQTVKAWEEELKRALSLGLTHYSLYQLTIEDGTPFHKKRIMTPEDDQARALYLKTNEIMDKAGIFAYEVSNYAKPGFESRHNMTYWLGADYIGIGPAAHGRVGLTETHNVPAVSKWLNTPMICTRLSTSERFTEKVLMGLRLTRTPFPIKGLSLSGLDEALKKGWITRTEDTLLPTPAGTLMLNQLILLLIP